MENPRRLPVLVRVGECNRCGDCCVAPDQTDDPFEGRVKREVDGMCQAFRRGEDGVNYCAVHGTAEPYWQNGCRLWPSAPKHVEQPTITRCSFRFVEAP